MDILQEYKADSFVLDFLYSYITIEHTFYDRFIILPDGCDYIVLSSKGYARVYEKKKLTQYIELEDESLFILRLKPYTLKIFEKYNWNLIEKLLHRIDIIFNTQSIIKKKNCVNELFILSEEKLKKFEILIDSVKIINKAEGSILVEEVAEKLTLSLRSLQRRYKDYIGISLKEYSNIIKIQSSIKKLNKLKFHNIDSTPKIYCDYSHFYKLFKKYTNLTPVKYYNTTLRSFHSIFDIY